MTHNCPFCYQSSATCNCGYAQTIPTTSPSHKEKGALKQSAPVIGLAIFIIVTLLHVMNWNQYFFEIIPLKMKQLTGIAKAPELKRIAEICKMRNKPHCETLAIETGFKMDNALLKEHLVRASEIYSKNGKHDDVIRILSSYFHTGGKERNARHILAKSLAATGRFKEAKKQFGYLVKTDAKDPNFNMAREYVELLMHNKDFKTAKTVIDTYRSTSKTAAYFLDKEMKVVASKLKPTDDFESASLK